MSQLSSPQAPAPAGGGPALLIVAVVMGLLTAGLTYFYTEQIRRGTRVNMVKIYRLNKDKVIGDRIDTAKDVIAVDFPRDLLESLGGVMSTPELNNSRGSVFIRPARQGEVMVMDMFYGDSGLNQDEIPAGKLAMALPVNSRANVSAMVRPNSFVDIFMTYTPPGQQPRSWAVMQRVKVLAVGSSTSRATTSFSSITIELEPGDAADLLTIAKFAGRDGFEILARNPTDLSTQFIGINPEVKKLVGLRR